LVEFGAQVLGVGLIELGEDGQGLLVGVAAGVGVAGGLVRVAEVGQSVGFVVAVADIPEQVEGVAVAGDGLGVVA
jgi:hypothetical protein